MYYFINFTRSFFSLSFLRVTSPLLIFFFFLKCTQTHPHTHTHIHIDKSIQRYTCSKKKKKTQRYTNTPTHKQTQTDKQYRDRSVLDRYLTGTIGARGYGSCLIGAREISVRSDLVGSNRCLWMDAWSGLAWSELWIGACDWDGVD